MQKGKRDLSSVALPVAISANPAMVPLMQHAIKNYFSAITTVIENEDKKIIETLEDKEASKYVQIELFMSLGQLIRETLDDCINDHVPGPDCPVCAKLNKLMVCSEVLVETWSQSGKFNEYADAINFRDGALSEERTVN